MSVRAPEPGELFPHLQKQVFTGAELMGIFGRLSRFSEPEAEITTVQCQHDWAVRVDGPDATYIDVSLTPDLIFCAKCGVTAADYRWPV